MRSDAARPLTRDPPRPQCCHPRKPGDKFFPCIDGFDPPEPLPTCAAD